MVGRSGRKEEIQPHQTRQGQTRSGPRAESQGCCMEVLKLGEVCGGRVSQRLCGFASVPKGGASRAAFGRRRVKQNAASCSGGEPVRPRQEAAKCLGGNMRANAEGSRSSSSSRSSSIRRSKREQRSAMRCAPMLLFLSLYLPGMYVCMVCTHTYIHTSCS